jgi:sugar O-acyltransferase (sialic acid O-acetyltransferase NeuD family)
MIIVGAGGHSRDLLSDNKLFDTCDNICFFDNVNKFDIPFAFDKYPVFDSIENLKSFVHFDKRFILAVGKPAARKYLSALFIQNGFEPFSFISNRSLVAPGTELGTLTDVMPFASVFAGSKIGVGSLINSYASVHHNTLVGNFCEISPGARLLGNVKIGDETSVGTNAIILPGIEVGSGVIIGAGAVVNKNLPDNCTAVGVPVKVLKNI